MVQRRNTVVGDHNRRAFFSSHQILGTEISGLVEGEHNQRIPNGEMVVPYSSTIGVQPFDGISDVNLIWQAANLGVSLPD